MTTIHRKMETIYVGVYECKNCSKHVEVNYEDLVRMSGSDTMSRVGFLCFLCRGTTVIDEINKDNNKDTHKLLLKSEKYQMNMLQKSAGDYLYYAGLAQYSKDTMILAMNMAKNICEIKLNDFRKNNESGSNDSKIRIGEDLMGELPELSKKWSTIFDVELHNAEN